MLKQNNKKNMAYSNRLNRPSGDISIPSASPMGFCSPHTTKNQNQSKIVDVNGSIVDFANITVKLKDSAMANMNGTQSTFDKNAIMDLARTMTTEFQKSTETSLDTDKHTNRRSKRSKMSEISVQVTP
jgi:hypothetical protein